MLIAELQLCLAKGCCFPEGQCSECEDKQVVTELLLIGKGSGHVRFCVNQFEVVWLCKHL